MPRVFRGNPEISTHGYWIRMADLFSVSICSFYDILYVRMKQNSSIFCTFLHYPGRWILYDFSWRVRISPIDSCSFSGSEPGTSFAEKAVFPGASRLHGERVQRVVVLVVLVVPLSQNPRKTRSVNCGLALMDPFLPCKNLWKVCVHFGTNGRDRPCAMGVDCQLVPDLKTKSCDWLVSAYLRSPATAAT